MPVVDAIQGEITRLHWLCSIDSSVHSLLRLRDLFFLNLVPFDKTVILFVWDTEFVSVLCEAPGSSGKVALSNGEVA